MSLPLRSSVPLRSRSRLAQPAAIAPEARLAELGAIFATAFRRRQLLQKSLEECAQPEAQSVPAKGAKEVA